MSEDLKLRRGFRALLDEANAQVATVPVEQAKAMHGRDDVLFVDLRDPRELEREGKIAGAFHCPRGLLEFWIDPESPYFKPELLAGKKLLFFCAGGWRSALAAKTVQDMGVDNVAHIEGGMSAWKKAGGTIESLDPEQQT